MRKREKIKKEKVQMILKKKKTKIMKFKIKILKN